MIKILLFVIFAVYGFNLEAKAKCNAQVLKDHTGSYSGCTISIGSKVGKYTKDEVTRPGCEDFCAPLFIQADSVKECGALPLRDKKGNYIACDIHLTPTNVSYPKKYITKDGCSAFCRRMFGVDYIMDGRPTARGTLE